jgi:hypothetical protein
MKRAPVRLNSIRDPELRRMLQRALARGWDIRRTGSGRLMLQRGRATVVVPSNPGNPRSVANSQAHLARQERNRSSHGRHR